MNELSQILADNGFESFEIISRVDNESILPATWQALAAAITLPEKKQLLLAYWAPVADKLPKTLALIDEYLQDVVVIRENGGYRLVYLLDIDDFLSVYVGQLPTQTGPYLEQMPEDLTVFYRAVHNGWFEKISGGLGPLPLKDIGKIGEEDWEIFEEEPTDLDLSKVFYIFHNGGSGYLCFYMTGRGETEWMICWTDQAPKRNVPFWGYLDAWIEIGLTN